MNMMVHEKAGQANTLTNLAATTDALQYLIARYLSEAERPDTVLPVVERGAEIIADIQAGALLGSPGKQLLPLGVEKRLPTLEAMLVANCAKRALVWSLGERADWSKEIRWRVRRYCRALKTVIRHKRINELSDDKRQEVEDDLTELVEFLENLRERVLLPEIRAIQYQIVGAV